MSQSEDKKDIKNSEVKEEQEETRLPVGELKWSKEQQEKEQQEKEQQEKEQQEKEQQEQEKEKELSDKDKNEKKDNKENTSEKNSVHSEISATLLEIEKEQESHISSHDEKEKENQKDKKKDPLANIEDTLTPIDFKTYEFDAEQLKAIEQELNALNPQKLEEELHTIHQQEHSHRPYNKLVDEVDDEEDDELEDRSNNKWLTRTIWIVGLPALLVIVLFVSLVIGHTVVGGQPVGDIFDISMWMHVYNLIYS
jgi:hypothetical protein